MTRKATAPYGPGHFAGACVDSGAEVSVVGRAQAEAYGRQFGLKLEFKESGLSFKFGSHLCKSLGKVSVRMPTPDGAFISFNPDVVDADVPMLIGLDLLESHGFLLDFSKWKISGRNAGWELPMVFKNGHIFMEWGPKDICLTRAELQCLHLHFFHPSVNELFELIRRARPEDTNSEMRKVLQDITDNCESCASYATKPFRFRASLGPDKILFNHEVSIDLIWLEGNPVLHVVDTHTHFQNATILRSKRSEDIWFAFVECWASVYVGYPRVIRLDQEASFRSSVFDDLATAQGIDLQFSGIEAHNAIGPGERYHAPLRRIFKIIRERYPAMEPEILLRYAVKGMNDTMGPDGLVPSLLVFGTIPSFPAADGRSLVQEERMQALEVARKEMSKITSEMRIREALRSRLPPSTKYDLHPGDSVRVFREGSKRWEGPFSITRIREKEVWVTDGRKEKQFSRTMVLPDPSTSADKELSRILDGFRQFKSGRLPGVMLTEVIHGADPRAKDGTFDPARASEMCGLFRKGAFKVTCTEEAGKDANILEGRFVLIIKGTETDELVFKARFVVQGHTGSEKNLLVNSATNVRQSSIRLLIAVAAIFRYRVWTQDVSQAYLQSAQKLKRKIFLRPPKEFQLQSDELLELLRPIYGLTDSGDYWHDTFSRHLKGDLNMQPIAGDFAMFTKRIGECLGGMVGVYVDDTLATGPPAFEKESRPTERVFESKNRHYDDVQFAGIEIERRKGGYVMHQSRYAQKMEQLDGSADFDKFRSLRHRLAWLTHTRPDLASSANILSQVTPEKYKKVHVKMLNAAIRKAKVKTMGLIQQDLDRDTLRMLVFLDSSFANNEYLTTQLGFVVLLTDETRRVNWLHYTSYKSKRVVRSVLGGETYAFADAFDFAFLMRHDLERILGRKLPLVILTDSESLFRVIVRATPTTEKRLMIDLRAVRESYEMQDISNVGWIRSGQNVADGLTKLSPCPSLDNLMVCGQLNLDLSQWVVRSGDDMNEVDRFFREQKMPSVGNEDNDGRAYRLEGDGEVKDVRGRGSDCASSNRTDEPSD